MSQTQAYEPTIQDLRTELRSLREENKTLKKANKGFKVDLDDIKQRLSLLEVSEPIDEPEDWYQISLQEYKRGEYTTYNSVEEMMADLEKDPESPE